MEITVTKKVLIAGNLTNIGYYLASKLREYGMEVDLQSQECHFLENILKLFQLNSHYLELDLPQKMDQPKELIYFS